MARGHNALVLAPTASGKSYVAQHNDKFVDGDEMIAGTTGWPSEKNWWLGRDAERIHRRNWDTLASADTNQIILFNGKGYDRGDFASVIVLIPTRSRIARNLGKHPHALRHMSYNERLVDIFGQNNSELRRAARFYGYTLIEGENADELLDRWSNVQARPKQRGEEET